MSTKTHKEGNIMTLVAPSGGVTSGQGYMIGAIFAVAQHSADEGENFEGAVTGIHYLPKTSGVASFTQGAKCYWNDTDKVVEATDTATNTEIGCAAYAASAADSGVYVKLNGMTPGAIGDLAAKANKVSGATADDLASLSSGGDLQDAGIGLKLAQLVSATNLAGVPFVIEVDVEASSQTITVFNANCPYDLQILDFHVLCTNTNAGGTAKLNASADGSGTDITDAVAMENANALARASQIVGSVKTIAANGSLSVVKNSASDQGKVYIYVVRV